MIYNFFFFIVENIFFKKNIIIFFIHVITKFILIYLSNKFDVYHRFNTFNWETRKNKRFQISMFINFQLSKTNCGIFTINWESMLIDF